MVKLERAGKKRTPTNKIILAKTEIYDPHDLNPWRHLDRPTIASPIPNIDV